MEKHEHYTYRITWSADDREYVGLCAEFPSLSWLAATRTGALEGIEKVVSETIDDMLAQGETRRRRWRKRTSAENWCCA